MAEYLIDCIECGGAKCRKCKHTGTESVAGWKPDTGFTVRGDDDGFDEDRQLCPCFQGIKVNDDVDQCIHPGNRPGDNWCEPRSCPLLREVRNG